MTHASLFSGIGGFDLAAQWMGWTNVLHCEINPIARQVLHYYWPNAISYEDIKTTDFTFHRGTIDVLTGGFPCQPYSLAGKRLGKADERHLWPEMLRAIREIQPSWIVGENVFGLVNWNGGMVFHEVQTDLEAEGYQVQPFILPACAQNAPHRRDRIWFVAYSNSARLQKERTKQQATRAKQSGKLDRFATNTQSRRNRRLCQPRETPRPPKGNFAFRGFCRVSSCNATNPHSYGQHRRHFKNEKHANKTWKHALNDIKPISTTNPHGERFKKRHLSGITNRQGHNTRLFDKKPTDWTNFPTQPPICGGNDGLPTQLDGITFSKWRNESIKAYGNAVVPQIPYQIFKAIEAYTQLNPP